MRLVGGWVGGSMDDVLSKYGVYFKVISSLAHQSDDVQVTGRC